MDEGWGMGPKVWDVLIPIDKLLVYDLNVVLALLCIIDMYYCHLDDLGGILMFIIGILLPCWYLYQWIAVRSLYKFYSMDDVVRET